jgi:hypothetical protein
MSNATVGALTDIHSSALNPLGSIKEDGTNRYIYLRGCASVVAADAVSYDEAFLATRLVASAVGGVAWALAAVVADKYGWFQISGTVTGNAAAAFADNGKVFATATPGVIDDAVVAGDQVVGAVGRSALSGSTATLQLIGTPVIGVSVV